MRLAVLVLIAPLATAKEIPARFPDPADAPPRHRKASYAIVVSRATAQDASWRKVVAALKEKHGAPVTTYGASPDESLDALKQMFPRYTCSTPTSRT